MRAEISAVWDKIQSMINDFIVLLPNMVLALIVFAIFFFVGREIKRVVRRVTRNHRQARNLGLVLGRLAQGITVLVGLFVALSIVIPTFRAGDLVQLLGISGVAIGFAFRDILQNFLAGILILLTEPFQIDDQIVFKNFEGTVEEIQTRATTIRTYDGRRVVIPNSELFTNSVTVNTAWENRRLEYDVGIGYGDDIDRAKQLMLEAVSSVDEVLSNEDIVEIGSADLTALKDCLAGMDNILSIKEDNNRLQVHFPAGTANMEAVNQFCFNKGITLNLLLNKKKSLETKFFELTND